MADEERNSGGAGEPPHRRRMPPPTIDLEATHVSTPSESAAAESAAAQPDQAPSEPATAAVEGDPAPVEPAASAPTGGPTEKPSAASDRPRGTSLTWSLAAAGALGAVLALIVAGALWALLGPAGEQADANARLARIESQLGALSRPAPAPAPASGDRQSLDDVTQRLGRIESTLGERLAAVDREIKPLTERLADLGRRDDDTVAAARLARERADAAAKSLSEVAQQLAQLNAARASVPAVERADLDALAKRLAGLEASTKQIGEQLTRMANASSPGNTRQAVVALALNSAVERGGPYARELAAIDPATAGPGTVEALKPFADTGVPSAAALARELAAVMPAALKAVEPPPATGGSFLERLESSASRLVRVRPSAQEAQPGDEPAAVLSRLQAKTARGDIAGGIAEAAKLPATVRAPLEPWIKRAQAREAAVGAAAALAAQSLDIIRRPSQGAANQ